jgi:PleD family two-component response regulator
MPVHKKATETAAKIIAQLRLPIEHAGRRFQIAASVGVASINDCEASELFRRADLALYAAKAGGRNTFRVFNAANMRD